MPQFVGRLRTPRLASAPSSPVTGEMYYDTVANVLYWWDGTAWKSGSGGAEVSIGASAPSPRVTETLWIDTDAPGPFGGGGPLVTSLPGSPVDAQECYYVADATNGVVWHLIYRAADPSAYKWQYVGGSELYVRSTASAAYTTPGTTYTAGAALAAPKLTLPLAGDWVIDWNLSGQTGTNIGDWRFFCFCGGADLGGGNGIMAATSTTMFGVNGGERVIKSGATASQVIDLRLAANVASSTLTVYDRFIAARPVRVG